MSTLGIDAAVLERARRVAADIADRVQQLGGQPVRVDADEIVTGRAALLGLPAPGAVSCGGATRLFATADGWCAFTLSRAEDVDSVRALLELAEQPPDVWQVLSTAAAHRRAVDLVERARLLGMPASVLGEAAAARPRELSTNTSHRKRLPGLLVVDLSSMWAGPLCGRLLASAGATVVKVETPARPDGTRAGDRAFFDWLNSEKLCWAGGFDSPEFAELLQSADVVIEASRPGSLARRGLGAEQMSARRGRVWLRISGYGSGQLDRVAFGDDAAVAGGLVRWTVERPAFCGDAIADPLTGLEATRAVLDSLVHGGGTTVEVSMAAVAAEYAALPSQGVGQGLPRLPVLPDRPARNLGADTAEVQRLIAARRVTC
jgi:hypothetical protein